MLKYSTLIIAEKDCDFNDTGKKFIDFQDFEYSSLSDCATGQNEKEAINIAFKDMVNYYMENKMQIPVPQGKAELPQGYVFHEVDWQDELRIHMFNSLNKMDMNRKVLESHLGLYRGEAEPLFALGTPMDIGLALEVIDHFDLHIKVNIEKVAISVD